MPKRTAEITDRPLNLVHACSALGSVHLLMGESAAAVLLERGLRPLVALCCLGLGGPHERVSNSTIAQDHLTRARRMFLDLGMRSYAEQSAAI